VTKRKKQVRINLELRRAMKLDLISAMVLNQTEKTIY